MSEEIRLGTMAMRLLRPIHPFVDATPRATSRRCRSAASSRSRSSVVLLVTSGAQRAHAPSRRSSRCSLVVDRVAWLITFAILFTIGALAFFLTQTMAISNLYFGLFSLFSGYLLPLDLLPRAIARLAAVLPFRFMLSVADRD